jgi:ABC-2 type transport system permease protein
MRNLDAGRIRAVVRKELRDYRRKRSIVVAMIILPAMFLIQPTLTVFLGSPGSLSDPYSLPLLLLLLIPVIMPSTLAAYSVVGEREQGTLEPLLTTPIRRQELILGKATAVMIPTITLSYVVFGLFFAVVALFARPAAVTGVFHQDAVIFALALLTPLLAGWAIVVGMAFSVRASEIRVAQQLGMIASFPPLGVVVALGIGAIHPTVAVAISFAVALLVIDVAALRIVSRMFDRERLTTGVKAARN